MKTDRFLLAILAGIALLAILALVLYFTRQSNLEYDPASTPDAVVKNYTLALYKADYQKAYTYLANSQQRPDYSAFRTMFANKELRLDNTSLRVGAVRIDGNQASVDITILHTGQDLFGGSNQEVGTAELVLQGSEWKITNLPYPFMNWGWIKERPTLLPAPTMTIPTTPTSTPTAG
jgi:hypothetical protein